MLSFKDIRALHTARQMRLHKTDRYKHCNRLATGYLKPWKSSKGYGSRSSQITTSGRKFARHIDNSIHDTILQLKTPKAFRHTLDDEDVDMDVAQECSHCDEYGYHDEGARQCRVEIDLMSLARPARTRKNKIQSRVNRVYASPFLERVEETLADDASDSNSSIAGSDYYSDFGWDDHSDAHSSGSCTSEEGEDNLDHPLEDVDFFTFVPIPTASLSRSPLVDEEESTTSLSLPSEFESAHDPRHIFYSGPLSPFSDGDDLGSEVT